MFNTISLAFGIHLDESNAKNHHAWIQFHPIPKDTWMFVGISWFKGNRALKILQNYKYHVFSMFFSKLHQFFQKKTVVSSQMPRKGPSSVHCEPDIPTPRSALGWIGCQAKHPAGCHKMAHSMLLRVVHHQSTYKMYTYYTCIHTMYVKK